MFPILNTMSHCVRFCYFRGKVVSQTRIGEIPCSVWVCLDRNPLKNVLDLDHFQPDFPNSNDLSKL